MSAERGRVDPSLVARARAELEPQLGAANLRVEAETLQAYGRDESDTGEFPSDLVVFPETREQVQAVFKTCGALGVPLTPVGARSGKSGGSPAVWGRLALTRTHEAHQTCLG